MWHGQNSCPAAARPPQTPCRSAAVGDTTAAIGTAIVGGFAAPFELLGVLLVASLLGALYFARTDD